MYDIINMYNIIFLGVVFLSLQYMWTNWENRQMEHLTGGDERKAAKNVIDTDKHVEFIQFHFERFSENNRFYSLKFLIMEVFQVGFCVCTVLYYYYILQADINNICSLITNFLKAPNQRNDEMIKLFPRKIGCVYSLYGPSGTEEKHNLVCQITNQEYIEALHILLFYFSCIILYVYIINIMYILLLVITSRKPVVLLFLQQNIDSATFVELLRKIKTGRNVTNPKQCDEIVSTKILK